MKNSRIKKIYLHIGLNKTATSSIQESLSCSNEILNGEGYLYPNFDDVLQNTNHNYPFLNYCKVHPEANIPNLIYGNHAPDYALKNKTKFVHSFKNQVEQFSGSKIIVSAEGLLTLTNTEINTLRTLLLSISAEDSEIEIIVFVRHPVYHAQSVIQQGIKTGFNILEKQIKACEAASKNFNMRVLNNFIDCFGKSSLKVFRFEDAVQHPYGPIGMFLKIIGFPDEKIASIPQYRINESISAEAVFFLSAINEHFPNVIDKKWNVTKEKLPLSIIINLQGQKFSLPFTNQINIWNASQNDRKFLVKNFGLSPYEFSVNNEQASKNLWGSETLRQLKKLVPDLPDEIKRIVAQVLENEILRSDVNISDDSKKQMESQIKSIRDSLPLLVYEKPTRRLSLIHRSNFESYFKTELTNHSICTVSGNMFIIQPVNIPFVINLPKILRSYESKTFIILNIHSSKNSTFTLEYQTQTNNDFETSISLRKIINEGMNNFEMVIPDFDFNGKTRLVFHDNKAVYKIQRIEIKTDAPSYEDLFKENERIKKQIERLEKAKANFNSPTKSGFLLFLLKFRNLLNTLKIRYF